ncbi:MAG TPA: cysteine desulfurase CsdA [Porphyromonadaceae bacterium]|nr:cysteine desulfurase CsdA [Porphyromonadaceae bacterium]
MDITKIRNDFPILKHRVYNKPLIYLDNAATTQKPHCVVDSLVDSYYNTNANVHRGVHFLSVEATKLHEEAREKVRQFLGAEKSSEIIFTRGTTESINLVASSFGMLLKDGDEIIVSQMEHHSNIVPWQLLQQRVAIKIKVVPIDEKGELNFEEYQKLFSEHTKLVSITHISNVLGTINPIQKYIDFAHQRNIPVLIDGAQAVAHISVDVKKLDADFYVFSGHKIYGPTGIGVLYGKEYCLNKIPPYQGGGEMIQRVTFEETTFNELPYKFEAGTPDFIGSHSLSTALEYVQQLGMESITLYEKELTDYALSQLETIPDMQIFGSAMERSGVISFIVQGIHPYDMGIMLDKLGIAIRTGHHCAQPLMQSLGVEGVARISFALYNTKEEIDVLIQGIRRVCKMLK